MYIIFFILICHWVFVLLNIGFFHSVFFLCNQNQTLSDKTYEFGLNWLKAFYYQKTFIAIIEECGNNILICQFIIYSVLSKPNVSALLDGIVKNTVLLFVVVLDEAFNESYYL